MANGTMYLVTFKSPPIKGNKETQFLFASLTAIYTVFTVEQIGCSYLRLYNLKVAKGVPYNSKTCEIKKMEFVRTPQKAK